MKILFLYSSLPFSNVCHGGGQWAFNFIKYFSKNHEIALCCYIEPELEIHLPSIKSYVKAVISISGPIQTIRKDLITSEIRKLFSSKPMLIQTYFKKNFLSKILNYLQKNEIDIIFYDKLVMGCYVEEIKKNFPDLKYVFHNDEVTFSSIRRNLPYLLKKIVSLFLKFKWEGIFNIDQLQITKLTRYEKRIWGISDLVICVSRYETVLVKKRIHNKNKVFYSPIGVQSNKAIRGKSEDWDNKSVKLVFIGNYNHPPNVDAVFYFCQKILPKIKRKIPYVKFYVIGKNGENCFQKLIIKKSIEFFGYISDLSKFYNDDIILVCPIRMGGGIRTKILNAMNFGIPIIGSHIALEGFLEILESGINCVLIDEKKKFSDELINLVNSHQLRYNIGREGHNLVVKHFSNEKIFQKLELKFKSLLLE